VRHETAAAGSSLLHAAAAHSCCCCCCWLAHTYILWVPERKKERRTVCHDVPREPLRLLSPVRPPRFTGGTTTTAFRSTVVERWWWWCKRTCTAPCRSTTLSLFFFFLPLSLQASTSVCFHDGGKGSPPMQRTSGTRSRLAREPQRLWPVGCFPT
jgi:hypothetical protein